MIFRICAYDETNRWEGSRDVYKRQHFPCATTCWTIRKETKSTKWTLLAFALPTVVGVLGCILVNLVGQLLL